MCFIVCAYVCVHDCVFVCYFLLGLDRYQYSVSVSGNIMSNIFPLHKNGPRDLAENYRPISLTSVCSKITKVHQPPKSVEKYCESFRTEFSSAYMHVIRQCAPYCRTSERRHARWTQFISLFTTNEKTTAVVEVVKLLIVEQVCWALGSFYSELSAWYSTAYLTGCSCWSRQEYNMLFWILLKGSVLHHCRVQTVMSCKSQFSPGRDCLPMDLLEASEMVVTCHRPLHNLLRHQQLSLSRWRPRSQMTLDGWIVDVSACFEQSVWCSFCNPSQIALV